MPLPSIALEGRRQRCGAAKEGARSVCEEHTDEPSVAAPTLAHTKQNFTSKKKLCGGLEPGFFAVVATPTDESDFLKTRSWLNFELERCLWGELLRFDVQGFVSGVR